MDVSDDAIDIESLLDEGMATECKAALKDIAKRFGFQNVQFFASFQAGEKTRYFETGFGNVFARHAQARTYVIKQEEYDRCEARRTDKENEGDA